MNGAAVRGDNAYLDPQGQRVYRSMSFELDTMDFFSKNPKAHIAVSPRAFLPYAVGGAMYNGYPAFTVEPEYNNAKVPYAMGSGIMQSTYQVNVSVKRSTCNASQTGTCQWVGYFIQEKQCSGFGCTWVPVARGAGANGDHPR